MKRSRILIVEDESLVRDMLHDFFVSQDLDAEKANDGEQALDRLRRGGIDLIISDLVMPQSDGLELLMSVQKESPEIPLIAITAPNNSVYLSAAQKLGAARCFEKPLVLAELLEAVQDLLPPQN